jgi:hypothetical protein
VRGTSHVDDENPGQEEDVEEEEEDGPEPKEDTIAQPPPLPHASPPVTFAGLLAAAKPSASVRKAGLEQKGRPSTLVASATGNSAEDIAKAASQLTAYSQHGSSKSNRSEMHTALNALMTASATAMHQSSHGVGAGAANAHGAGIEAMLADPFLINADEALAIRNIDSFVDKLPFKVSQNELKLSTLAVFDDNLLLLHSLSKMQPAQMYDWLSSSPHNMKTGAAVACCRLLTAMVGFKHPFVDEHDKQF